MEKQVQGDADRDGVPLCGRGYVLGETKKKSEAILTRPSFCGELETLHDDNRDNFHAPLSCVSVKPHASSSGFARV